MRLFSYGCPQSACQGRGGVGKPQVSHRVGWVWSALRKLFNPLPRTETVPAVCIPPGARLLLEDIPAPLQRDLEIGSTEEVAFTQLTASEYAYRDAIRFGNGHEVLLQKLGEGQRAKVLDLSAAESFEPPKESVEWMFQTR